MLYAIAKQESTNPKKGYIWPWTINFNKQGYYFPTKEKAHEAIKLLIKNGVTSVDIGVMQTNWYWQKDRLKDTWAALDPSYNIRIGAQILRDCYQKKNSWFVCTGEYHSPGTAPKQVQRAKLYRESVFRKLKEIKS